MGARHTSKVSVRLCRGVLESIFDECDRFDDSETGGRLVGTFSQGATLAVEVAGVIDAGPKARRTRSSLFQDGDYQHEVFRKIERQNPAVEHLGTWHTHHVNGYPELSSGDLKTYRRIVNHRNHNTDFLYALLVLRRVVGPSRYAIRHYLLMRGDDTVNEIPEASVQIVGAPVMWIPKVHAEASTDSDIASKVGNLPNPASSESFNSRTNQLQSRPHRDADNRVLGRMFPDLRPRLSKTTQLLHWKGQLSLLDGSRVAVIVVESNDGPTSTYAATVSGTDKERVGTVSSQEHDTPWMAVREVENVLNLGLLRREQRASRAERPGE